MILCGGETKVITIPELVIAGASTTDCQQKTRCNATYKLCHYA